MVGVDISQDGRALIGVGLDAHARQLMVLWDISQLRFGGKVGGWPQSWRNNSAWLAAARATVAALYSGITAIPPLDQPRKPFCLGCVNKPQLCISTRRELSVFIATLLTTTSLS